MTVAQSAPPVRSALTWLLAFGIPRGMMRLGVRAGDLISRALGDPALADDPFAHYDAVRARGPVVRGRGIRATALRALYTRFPGLRLATAPSRRPTRVLRGYRHLEVRTG